MKYIFTLLISFLFISCEARLPELDVSKEKKYSKIINKTFKTIKPLTIHANLVDDFKSKEVRTYAITSSESSYGGRYVLWAKELPINTLFKTKQVLQWNSILSNDFKIVINIEKGNFEYAPLPILIDSGLTLEPKNNEYLLMNSEYFEEVE